MSDPTYPWERRRPGELTSEYLGRVLDWVEGLGDMPRRAREGHFDDYFCPAEVADGLEHIRLANELHSYARSSRIGQERRKLLLLLIVVVKTGEFDATKEEADRWMVSADGQAAFAMLVNPGQANQES
jgi:hypothetical protein